MFHRRRGEGEEEEAMVTDIRNLRTPAAFDRHFYHIDWAKHDLEVNLVNMVREPVDRMVSNYYFVRNPRRWEGREVVPGARWFTKSLQSCVLGGDTECQVHQLILWPLSFHIVLFMFLSPHFLALIHLFGLYF